ncbi:uncharacterized protein LOC129590994 [Paramacrobiotus metropolitanus]|uniref:uncharacterized protein LOC129590994 n=1 Tax=Paramacrobiotus metropolitanus TaxID=2943436 RepID=UPI002446321C|nr:uncharacterized protein LOC129590994 [Paramacrobiotus metropolitanus]
MQCHALLVVVSFCLWVSLSDAGRLPPGVTEQQLMACEKVKNLFPPCARFLQCNMNAVSEEQRMRRKNHLRHCFRSVSPACKNIMNAMRDSPEMQMCNPPRQRRPAADRNQAPLPVAPVTLPPSINTTQGSASTTAADSQDDE